jgi:hypothetical protein
MSSEREWPGIKEADVHYRTDWADVNWATQLDWATNLEELRAVVARWPSLTDAAGQVVTMTDKDFAEWQKFRVQQRRLSRLKKPEPEPSDELFISRMQRFGAILIPERFLNVVTLADTYKAPFGTAWIRVKEFLK